MDNVIQYKGYLARINYSSEDQILYGKIEGIDDWVTFEADSASEIEKEFHSAVDDYLAYCEEKGVEPSKSYKGSFNVRVSPELHKQAAMYGIKNGINLNQTVEMALKKMLNPEQESKCRICMMQKEASYPEMFASQLNDVWKSAKPWQDKVRNNYAGKLQ